jgi:hypothetical protein
MAETAQSRSVRPRVSHHQYQVESDRERFEAWPDSADGLLTGEDTWFAVITGVEYGHADVTLRLLSEAGPVDSVYEMTAERDFYVRPGKRPRGTPKPSTTSPTPYPHRPARSRRPSTKNNTDVAAGVVFAVILGWSAESLDLRKRACLIPSGRCGGSR